jgi:1,4-dihydroxy-2-naphthoate octaprenyltransferase
MDPVPAINLYILMINGWVMGLRVRGAMISKMLLMLELGRFHFLAGGFVLYIIGVQLALLEGYPFDPLRASLGYMVLFFAHLSVSYSNDRFDMAADRHNRSTPFSGGSGVLIEHPELASASLVTALVLILFSLITAGIYSAFFGFDPFFIGMVLLGNALGWSYTSPPLRLAYRGFGELSTSFAVGVLVTAYAYYVASGAFDATYLHYAVPFMIYGIIFIFAVQIPDMEADIKGGKRTIVTIIGRKASFFSMTAMSITATAGLAILWLIGEYPLPFDYGVLTGLSLIPLAFSIPVHIFTDPNRRSSSIYSSILLGSVILMFVLIAVYMLLLNLNVLKAD